jgi:hypothetical protein
MKNKIAAILAISLIFFTLGSCKKTWQCTCSATTVAAPNDTVTQGYTINTTSIKAVAQADCNYDCSNFLNNPQYKNGTAKITP